MDSIVSKVDVGRHVTGDPQNPHPDVDTEVRNQGLDPALPKKSRAKPKPIRRKKSKLYKKARKSPVVPLLTPRSQRISRRPLEPPEEASVNETMNDWAREKILRKCLDLMKLKGK